MVKSHSFETAGINDLPCISLLLIRNLAIIGGEKQRNRVRNFFFPPLSEITHTHARIGKRWATITCTTELRHVSITDVSFLYVSAIFLHDESNASVLIPSKRRKRTENRRILKKKKKKRKETEKRSYRVVRQFSTKDWIATLREVMS